MPSEQAFLDVTLLGREYRIACPPEERAALEAAAALVDSKMKEAAARSKAPVTERIAVMVALNIAHEYLGHQKKTENAPVGCDEATIRRRIETMEAQLDEALRQEALAPVFVSEAQGIVATSDGGSPSPGAAIESSDNPPESLGNPAPQDNNPGKQPELPL